jgi:hypothetical protein
LPQPQDCFHSCGHFPYKIRIIQLLHRCEWWRLKVKASHQSSEADTERKQNLCLLNTT